MLELEIEPGIGAGFFKLGMIIYDVINLIQDYHRVINRVELKYCKEKPLSTDIALDLVEDGVLLRFEPRQQRLRSIEIYDVNLVRSLSFKRVVFGSPQEKPTFHKVYNRFGPSTPGDYSETKQSYYLHYPGVSFLFPIPQKYAKYYSSSCSDLPLEFPGGLSPVTSRIHVYAGTSHQKPILPALPVDSLYYERVEVHIGKGLRFTKRNCVLSFRCSAQDALTDLGRPDRIFYKQGDSMQVHRSAQSTPKTARGCPDYFYNYFSLGLDILFDSHTHVAKKMVLHTNFPSHFDFHQYAKCNFEIIGLRPILPQSLDELTQPVASTSSAPKDTLDIAALVNDPGPITSDSHWDDVKRCFKENPGRPIVHNQGLNSNPFGATRFYGYQDIIFEIMSNNHIASILLFSHELSNYAH